MARHKDEDWNLPERLIGWDQVNAAILMDIRAELKRLNTLLHCGNFIRIPAVLDKINANTRKPKRKRAARKS